MRSITRRDFLHNSTALASALAGAGFVTNAAAAAEEAKEAKKADASEQLNVAVVGVNSRGRDHVNGFAGHHNCAVTTICDVDDSSEVIARPMNMVEKAQGKTPKFEKDIRKVLDDKSIHIVSIATPNHWHALAAIWALQAGKDVYVEKPVSHNVLEGRRIVEAARKYNRICQTGTQARSMATMHQIMSFLRSGKLGKITLARGLCYKKRLSIGKADGEQPIPATIDYDLWCGPGPKKPLLRKRLHYDWHWTWDFGNGDLGNQGIHEMDKARWGLGKNELPRSVLSLGGRFGYVDDGETANTQMCVFDYGDCALIFEVRGLPSRDLLGASIGNIFYGTEGYLVATKHNQGAAFNKDGEIVAKFQGDGDHYGNFVKAVRSRKVEDLNADILEGHLSSALCHLGNISYRLGTPQPFSKKTQAFGDDKEAAATLERMEEHLRSARVPLDETSYRLGRKLSVDPKTESFVDDKEADALLTRDYRKPFVVPEQV